MGVNSGWPFIGKCQYALSKNRRMYPKATFPDIRSSHSSMATAIEAFRASGEVPARPLCTPDFCICQNTHTDFPCAYSDCCRCLCTSRASSVQACWSVLLGRLLSACPGYGRSGSCQSQRRLQEAVQISSLGIPSRAASGCPAAGLDSALCQRSPRVNIKLTAFSRYTALITSASSERPSCPNSSSGSRHALGLWFGTLQLSMA